MFLFVVLILTQDNSLCRIRFIIFLAPKRENMKNLLKIGSVAVILALLSGCSGSVYNKEKNCEYDYLLHPAISVSKIIGGCGPTE